VWEKYYCLGGGGHIGGEGCFLGEGGVEEEGC
jgi:hypothetical protein